MAAKKPAAEKKPGLDIKDEMLYSDYRVFEWLDGQTPEMAKSFSPLVAMKWQSVVQNPTGYDDPMYQSVTKEIAGNYILSVNEIVNLDFWDLSRHPELQWRLMCAAGTGIPYKHGWVKMASSRKKIGKLDAVLLGIHPHLNDEELAILKGKYTVETMRQLLKDMALTDPEIKPLVEEFKKTNG
jgi:hypothetical protein